MTLSAHRQRFRHKVSIYAFAVLIFLFILMSHPFMHIPFDIWEHLMRITSIYETGECFIFSPEDIAPNMNLWHWLWAQIFKLAHISDVFLWARIIHVVQFSIAAVSIYYFSKTTFELINKNQCETRNQVLALCSSLLWFLGNGTISIQQQSWINWYSVTYQGLSIPLLWISLAITMQLLYKERLSTFAKSLHIFGIAFLTIFVLFLHPTEFIFYAIYVSVFSIANLRRWLEYSKDHVFQVLTLVCGVFILLVTTIKSEVLPLPVLLHDLSPRQLLTEIRNAGNWVTRGGGNRFPYAISEIAIVSLLSAFIFRGYLFFTQHTLNTKLYDCLFASSLIFVAIPLFGPLAGIFAIATHREIVWRFFFGSAWFVFLPLVINIFSEALRKQSALRNTIIIYVGSILTFLSLSRFVLYQSFYQNTVSMMALLDAKKVGLQYSQTDMETLAKVVAQQSPPFTVKPSMLYIRGDLAPLVRTALRKYVYADRRQLITKSSFYERGLEEKYVLIDIELPPDFPRDENIFKFFDLDKK